MNEASENNSAADNISSCPKITTIRGSRGTKSFNNRWSIIYGTNVKIKNFKNYKN